MKTNKGFGVISILLIVVGVLVVGGGAYYVGKTSKPVSDNTVPQDIPDDIFTTTPITNTGCKTGDAPWIKVLSPNGGEIYKVGDNLNIRWISCNINKDVQVFAQLAVGSGQGEYSEGLGGMEGNAYYSSNDGSENINLLPKIFGPDGFNYGKRFRIQVTLTSNSNIFDYSDSYFTINSNVVKKDCSTWATFNGAYTIKYPSCWVASSFNGGSIGTANEAVGVLLKPSVNSLPNDSISIGGFQYDCNQVNVSGGTYPATKAYCIESVAGNFWVGQYITSSNQGTIYGAPVTTHSINPDVLEMFNQIVDHNKVVVSSATDFFVVNVDSGINVANPTFVVNGNTYSSIDSFLIYMKTLSNGPYNVNIFASGYKSMIGAKIAVPGNLSGMTINLDPLTYNYNCPAQPTNNNDFAICGFITDKNHNALSNVNISSPDASFNTKSMNDGWYDSEFLSSANSSCSDPFTFTFSKTGYKTLNLVLQGSYIYAGGGGRYNVNLTPGLGTEQKIEKHGMCP